MKPLVSVVVTSYNYAHYICTAIDSVLSQDYDNVEVVVTDNCSTDNTLEVLEKYASDARVRVSVNPSNIGITPNTNAGIRLATGEFVVILSADDWLLPGHLSRLVMIAERYPEAGMIYGGALLCSEGRPPSVRHVMGQTLVDYGPGREELGLLLAACYMCLPAVLFRRELFDRFGLFDERFAVASDWEITLRFVAAGVKTAHLAAPVVAVRLHDKQASGPNYVRSGAEFTEHLQILERFYDGSFDRAHGREQLVVTALRVRYNLLKSVAPEMITEDRVVRANRAVAQLEADGRRRSSRNPPSVAIVVTSMGRFTSLTACLKSIASQTYPNWQLWLLQDHSFDVSGWAAQFVPAEKFQYCRSPDQLGIPLLRNQAFLLASADYYLFVDEDAEIAPKHLEELVTAAQAGDGVAVARTIVQFNRLDEAMGWAPVGHTEATYPVAPTAEDLLVANSVPLPAVLFDCAAAAQLEHFDPGLGICADWEFLLRLGQIRKFAYTRTRTLVEHAFLGLRTQALQAQWNSYVQCLDGVYARHVVPHVDLVKARERHRAAIIAAMQQGPADYMDVNALFNLYGVLAGSAARALPAPV